VGTKARWSAAFVKPDTVAVVLRVDRSDRLISPSLLSTIWSIGNCDRIVVLGAKARDSPDVGVPEVLRVA